MEHKKNCELGLTTNGCTCTKKEDWETYFNEKFKNYANIWNGNRGTREGVNVKQFIRDLLIKEREKHGL